MKLIKFITVMFFFIIVSSSISEIFTNIIPAINGFDGALRHILFGIFLVILFGYLGVKLVKSAQNEDKK